MAMAQVCEVQANERNSSCEVMGGHRKGLRKLKELSLDPDEQVRLALAAPRQ